ncbi:MAG: hypothetical protein JXB46_04360, partial [Candidatus Eisenbacteria bacterium]|nr:hypothetical protein [Candidatus Eisenbacteria bacterium]
MRHANTTSLSILCVALVVAALTCVGWAETTLDASGERSPNVAPPQEQGSLNANVYVQTSGEYRACCYGIYAAAGLRLEELLEDAEPAPVRPAVVMDLDETVLDNASFQTLLYENNLDYTPALWVRFEREGANEVGLVPGAAAFIERA